MQRSKREPMAPVDAAWLRMEDPTNLMMISGVLTFDQPIDSARFRQVLEQRLVGRFERFRKKAVLPGDGVGAPYWEFDPHFNIAAHIHRVALPAPGDQKTLQDLVSDLMSTPLDFSKPPWQFHIVEGFGNGCALISRLHHSIADGIALVYVLLSLTDHESDPMMSAPEPAQPTNHDPLQALLRPVRQTTELVAREANQLLENPGRLLELAKRGSDGLVAFHKLVFQSTDPPTVLKGPLGVQKKAAWSQPMNLEQIKAIGKVTGATINDVLMAAATGALRRYLLWRGTDVEGLQIRAVVPVNLRQLDRPQEMGNKFGVVFLTLPVGIADPYDRLLALHEGMEDIKDSPEAVVAFGILGAMGIAPESLQDMGVSMFGSKATAVITNVPGPRQPIYMAGNQIRGVMFWVPQSGHLGIGISIFSYAGEVLVGVATDADLIPEPEQIVDGFQDEIDLLFELVRGAR